MNPHRLKSASAPWLVTAAIAIAAVASGTANQTPQNSQSHSDHSRQTSTAATGDTQKIQIASDNLNDRTAEYFTDKDVRGTRGNHVGNVADVIVDCPTSKIAFVVVSHGGVVGLGDTLRLVPFAAVSRSTTHEGFTVSVTEAQWNKMPEINQQDFEAGRINITADQQRQLAEVSDENADASAENRGDFGQRLARAAKLRGQSVRANNQEVGEIEAVVLDLERGTATALFDADDNFAQAENNYLVPLNHFDFTADRDALTTTLAATDFPNATGSSDRDAIAEDTTNSVVATDTMTTAQTNVIASATDRIALEDRPAGEYASHAATTNDATATDTTTTAATDTSTSSDATTTADTTVNTGETDRVAAGDRQTGEYASDANTTTSVATADTSTDVSTTSSDTNRVAAGDRADEYAAGANRSNNVSTADTTTAANTSTTVDATVAVNDPAPVATENRPAGEYAGDADVTATRTQTNSGDEQLTPTGRVDNAEANRGVAPDLQSAARAIRQIWDAHPSLAKLDLQVTPENGRLIFRGTVPNADLWERAKDTAESVVRGIDIENRISIEGSVR